MMSPQQDKKPQTPLLQNMLTENPLMSAAMQQMMTAGAGAAFLSSADLMQQAHALQLLAQLQSVLMMNNPLMSKLQQSQVTQ